MQGSPITSSDICPSFATSFIAFVVCIVKRLWASNEHLSKINKGPFYALESGPQKAEGLPSKSARKLAYSLASIDSPMNVFKLIKLVNAA